MTDKVKCCEKLYADFHYYPCARNATTEHEGKPYCKTHNPALRQAKQDASTQAWKAEMAAKTEKRTADAHKIAVHDDLLSALQRLVDSYTTSHDPETRRSCWEQAHNAINRAKG